MIKVAVFCEGQTELRFCKRLFDVILGSTCKVETEKFHGRTGVRFVESKYRGATEGEGYLIRILDCGGGGKDTVTSDILEHYEKFIRTEGYEFIIGIRDIHPQPRSHIDQMRASATKLVPPRPIAGSKALVVQIFSIMEIEAWFLAEHTHFIMIDKKLTREFIHENMRFDPSVDDMQSRDRPANDLKRIYELVATTYDIARTVAKLDMNRIYLELPDRYSPLRELTQTVDLIYAAGRPKK